MPHQVVGGGGCSQQCPRIMSHQKGTDETPFKGEEPFAPSNGTLANNYGGLWARWFLG
jgi:hypothetical protein